MNKTAFQALRSVFLRAFSLVELMVTLIVISCIISALVPAITKKLKSQAITVGSGGGGNTNLEFEQDCSAFGVDCALCFEDRCAMCAKSCEDDEFVNTPQCTCESCTLKSENCVTCTSKGCTKCATGYGLSSLRMCQQCQTSQYSDGTNPCTTCPENHYCNGITSVACSVDEYAPEGSTSCTLCSETYSNCATCNKNECLTCKKGYKLEENNCILISGSEAYTAAGNYEFTVPDGVEQLTATLVSGGAGGGGGVNVTKNETFVTAGNGDVSTQNANNILHVNSNGIITWTIPAAIKGKTVKVSACGGGGGSGQGGAGGKGGAIKNASFTVPNWTSLKIHIGGAGGSSSGSSYPCSLGGYGGGTNSNACNASSGYGSGSASFSATSQTTPKLSGGGGYDPIYGGHGSGGGSGGIGNFTTNWSRDNTVITDWSGNGSLVGGGGGSGSAHKNYGSGSCPRSWCWLEICKAGGGGAATLFYHSEYAKTASLVAPGGGGGGGYQYPQWYDGWGNLIWMKVSCYGGGGGGTGGGNGASGQSTGGNGSGYGNTIFSGNYCAANKPGAMRITYTISNAGTGGGAGQIVAKQKIAVTSGEILTITVGAGGAGGAVNSNGVGADASMMSKITKSDGTVLLSTTTSFDPKGGQSNGTTVGAAGKFSNGKGSEASAISGYAITSGAATSGTTGGAGGSTTLSDTTTHCTAGAGGNGAAGSKATGFGGCGGGGGGAGYAGGAGAPGYVKISWGEE